MKKYIPIAFAIFFVVVTSAASSALAASFTFTQPLTLGSRGVEVTQLQMRLTDERLYSGPITGYYGPLTMAAVSAFQMANGLEAIGSVGPRTRAALNASTNTEVIPPQQEFSDIAPTTTAAPVSPSTNTPMVLGAATTTVTAATATTDLPYRAPSFNGWTKSWGSVTTTASGSLLIKATASTTGAGANLLASSNWTDYRYTAGLTVTNGDITLYGRYVDAKNFAACVFTGNQVSIIQRINGTAKTVATKQVSGLSSGLYVFKNTTVALRVKGSTIGCSALGPDDNVTYTNLDPALSKGGIGIETWQSGGGSILDLESVRVDPI